MKRILKLSIARLAQLVELGLGELLVHLEEDLARLLVDDVVRGDLADELFGVDRQAIELRRRLSFLIAALVNLVFFLTMTSRADLDVARRALAGEEVVLDALGVLVALLEVDRLRWCRSS